MKNKFESLKVKLCALIMFLSFAACENRGVEQTETPQETKTEIRKQETAETKSISPALDTVLVIKHQDPYYSNPAGVIVVNKNGEEFYIGGYHCVDAGEIARAERGDELVIKRTPAPEDDLFKDEFKWQVVENLTANRLKDQWLQEQRQKGQY